jgi:hypothetical protein
MPDRRASEQEWLPRTPDTQKMAIREARVNASLALSSEVIGSLGDQSFFTISALGRPSTDIGAPPRYSVPT